MSRKLSEFWRMKSEVLKLPFFSKRDFPQKEAAPGVLIIITATLCRYDLGWVIKDWTFVMYEGDDQEARLDNGPHPKKKSSQDFACSGS